MTVSESLSSTTSAKKKTGFLDRIIAILIPMNTSLSYTLRCLLIGAISLGSIACSSAEASLSEGESHVTLRLSGGTLAEPIEFDGTSDTLRFYAYSEVSVMGEVRIPSSDGAYELARVNMSIPSLEERVYELDRFSPDVNIDGFTNDEGKTISHSFRPIEGEGGTLEVLERSEQRLHLKFDTKVAPLTIGYKDLVFHMTGEITIQK